MKTTYSLAYIYTQMDNGKYQTVKIPLCYSAIAPV